MANLYIRVTLPGGARAYLKPVYNSNGRLKPHYASVDGKPEHYPDGVYYVRYGNGQKRIWEFAGSDPALAIVALQRRKHQLEGLALGLQAPEPISPSEPSIVPFTPEQSYQPKHLLTDSSAEYLREIADHKSKKTYAAYSLTLRLFKTSCAKEILEDLTRSDLLNFASRLKQRGNSPRTIRNRIDYFQIFLHHFGLPSLLQGKDLPKYTQKKVRAYSSVDLDKMFRHADQDESDLLHFLLCTGTREQEAQYACWTDVDLTAKTYTVTEHLDLGYKPKDSEEGTFPIPDSLVEILSIRRERFPHTRLIFPGKGGKPEGHLLRIVKSLALRAGANCGQCVNPKGKTCATHPVCKHIGLHKMRKTYATRLHRSGLPPKTLMRYLRHSALETTLLYIDDQDDDQTRSIVNASFAALSTGGAV